MAEAVMVASLRLNARTDSIKIRKWADHSLNVYPNAAWALFPSALARFADADYSGALADLDRSLGDPMPVDWNGWTVVRYLYALSQHQLGHGYDARRWFELAEASLASEEKLAAERPIPPTDYYVIYELHARVLQREARAVFTDGKNSEKQPASLK